MRNKTCVILASLLIVVFLGACSSSNSLAPWSIPGSSWNDSANGIVFTVPESEDAPITGTYTVDGESCEITVKHDRNSITILYNSDESLEAGDSLLQGSCKYDELIMTVIVEDSSVEGIEKGSVLAFFKAENIALSQ